MGPWIGTYHADKDGLGPEGRGEQIQQWMTPDYHYLLRRYTVQGAPLKKAQFRLYSQILRQIAILLLLIFLMSFIVWLNSLCFLTLKIFGVFHSVCAPLGWFEVGGKRLEIKWCHCDSVNQSEFRNIWNSIFQYQNRITVMGVFTWGARP